MEAPGAHSTTPSLPTVEAPPAKSIPLPTAVDVDHTPPGCTDTPTERGAMLLPAKPEVETSQGTSTSQDTRMVAQIAPTTGSVVELTGPLVLSDQTKDERQYVLIITALVRRLNLEMTGVILRETMTASAGEVASENP